MESSERPRPHRPEDRCDDDEHQEELAGLPAIALDEDEAARFLKALAQPCGRTVTRLANLRRRA